MNKAKELYYKTRKFQTRAGRYTAVATIVAKLSFGKWRESYVDDLHILRVELAQIKPELIQLQLTLDDELARAEVQKSIGELEDIEELLDHVLQIIPTEIIELDKVIQRFPLVFLKTQDTDHMLFLKDFLEEEWTIQETLLTMRGYLVVLRRSGADEAVCDDIAISIDTFEVLCGL